MTFTEAVKVLTSGRFVTREEMDCHGEWLSLQQLNTNCSKSNKPYISLYTEKGVFPWVPSLEDILAEDWFDLTEVIQNETGNGTA